MNLQERLNDASRSEDIFLKYKEDPLVPDKTLYYRAKSLNASPHSYIIYNFSQVRQEERRSILLNNFYQQIIDLKNLPKGWDSYNADPPNDKALINALNILDLLFESAFYPTRIVASVEGGVSFLFIRDIKYADIECDNDSDILAGMSDRTGEPILWQVSQKDEEKSLSKTISKISSFLET